MSFKALSEKIDFELVKELSKLTPEQAAMKAARDKELHDIIEGKDDRILLVIGPCSAHDEEAVMEYVRRLAKLQEQVKDKVFMVPRIYTNKPHTTGDGYKGLLHKQDPTGEQPDARNRCCAQPAQPRHHRNRPDDSRRNAVP